MQIKTSFGQKLPFIYQDALTLRQQVFTDEQGFDPNIDLDEYDEKSLHVVLYDTQKPVGVLRVIFFDNEILKVGRVAILKEYRGTGLGLILMNFVHSYGRANKFKVVKLSAQCHAIPFYQKQGYQIVGEVYDEEGVDHIAMELLL